MCQGDIGHIINPAFKSETCNNGDVLVALNWTGVLIPSATNGSFIHFSQHRLLLFKGG